MKVKLVSGYVDLGRDNSKFKIAGDKLRKVNVPKYIANMYPLEGTWMHQFVQATTLGRSLHDQPPLRAAYNGNATKDTVDYMCVQHEKVEWMRDAARNDPHTDVFVWLDYGIFNLKGVTQDHVEGFLKTAEGENFISIPGCWDKAPVADDKICWRFCGGALVAHRRHLDALGQEIRNVARTYILEKGIVEWEVNTWARVELEAALPIRWYSADHNPSMLINYLTPKLSGL